VVVARAAKTARAPRGMGFGMRLALSAALGMFALLCVLFLILQAMVVSSLRDVEDAGLAGTLRGVASGGAESWFVAKGKGFVGLRGSFRRLQGLLEGVKEQGVWNIFLRDPSGRVVLSVYKVDGFRADGPGFRLGEGAALFEGEYRSGKFTGRVRLYRRPLKDREGRDAGDVNLVVKDSPALRAAGRLRLAIFGFGALAVVLLFLLVSGMAGSAARPLRELVSAVRRLNRGNLHYRADTRRKDEIGDLARALQAMVEELRSGAEAAERLEAREREAEILVELQDALLPRSFPEVEGFELDALHQHGVEGAADFYDFIPLEGGGVAIVVASTSGHGALGSLLSGMTRSFLRAYLECGRGAAESLRLANRHLASAMRKGHYVTAQLAVLDPVAGEARVCIAGHTAPFYACRGGEISVVHGEGLALGLDSGPVFDSRLEEVVVEMPPGTRIVLTTCGTYEVPDPQGRPFGLPAFQDLVRRHAPKNSGAFLHLVFGALDTHLGERERPADATLVTVKRMV